MTSKLTEIVFHNRRAVQIENDLTRVTVTVEGGHIAEILEKSAAVNPLWIPPWPSIEPSTYSLEKHPAYGKDAESKLLSGIMGHNLCLDLFGPPSEAEAAAGFTVHGEASIVPYEINAIEGGLTAHCTLPVSQLAFERQIRLQGRRVLIRETVENLSKLDRPIAWTQHVTLGAPFIERGKTQFRLSATKSLGLGESVDFAWPLRPRDGGAEDLRVYSDASVSGGFTTHLMNPSQDWAWFFGWSPTSQVCIGYVWRRTDFPWLGIWEENRSRSQAPWSGETVTRGMEFGVSPFPEPRRDMIDRHTLFNTPTYRWIGAKTHLVAEYYAAVTTCHLIPESPAEFDTVL